MLLLLLLNQLSRIKIAVCLTNLLKTLKKITFSQLVFRGPTFMDQKKSVSKMRKGFDSAREKQKKKRLCMSLPPKYQNLFHNALSIRIMVIIAQLYLSLQSNWKDANANPAGCNPATTPIVTNVPRKCTRSHCLNHMSDITDWNEFDPIPTIF